MMLSLTYLLSLLLSVYAELTSEGYILDINNGRLKNIQLNGDFNPELDLSNMNLTVIEQGAFDNVSDIESLDLSDNSLVSLPESLFSNLNKLQNLSLANNKIDNIHHLFIGLENLQQLDISNTSVRHLRSGDLFGLNKSVKILTNGNTLWSISTAGFLDQSLDNKELNQTKIYKHVYIGGEHRYSSEAKIEPADVILNDYHFSSIRDSQLLDILPIPSNSSVKNVSVENQENLKFPKLEFIHIKLCKSNGIVTSLGIVSDYDELAEDCFQMPQGPEQNDVHILFQEIEGFQEGWYQLQSLPITRLHLSFNNITEITKETLNNLPENLTYVNFMVNKISKIPSDVIENHYLQTLNFDSNLIEEIDEGALRNTELTDLYLLNNRLKDLNFITSLPHTMINLILNNNSITSIPNDLSTNLPHLQRLNLDINNIEVLKDNSFHGLTSLQWLHLENNNITTIESDAFKDLNSLWWLSLKDNRIDNLQEGTFAKLDALRELDLSRNKISKATFADLPKNLTVLRLDDNEIDTLENGSFVDSPTETLSLQNNRISSIKQGAFNLPTLRDLTLNRNSLTVIDGDSYEGLDQLKYLWLRGNNISEILDGAGKHLGNINILDISQNPFETLGNGNFQGIKMARGSILYVYYNCLKEIYGGIFNNL